MQKNKMIDFVFLEPFLSSDLYTLVFVDSDLPEDSLIDENPDSTLDEIIFDSPIVSNEDSCLCGLVAFFNLTESVRRI